MDLRQQVEGYPGTEPAAFARLNLALCAMHFGDFAAAHEHLLKARDGAARRGRASRRARRSTTWASRWSGSATRRKRATPTGRPPASKDATLFNNDGPAVAPLAARRAATP